MAPAGSSQPPRSRLQRPSCWRVTTSPTCTPALQPTIAITAVSSGRDASPGEPPYGRALNFDVLELARDGNVVSTELDEPCGGKITAPRIADENQHAVARRDLDPVEHATAQVLLIEKVADEQNVDARRWRL